MKTILVKSIMFMILFSVGGDCWSNPCQLIAQACMQAGYQRGASPGQRLIKDCVIPITKKQKKLLNTHFTDDTLEQCSTFIAKRING